MREELRSVDPVYLKATSQGVLLWKQFVQFAAFVLCMPPAFFIAANDLSQLDMAIAAICVSGLVAGGHLLFFRVAIVPLCLAFKKASVVRISRLDQQLRENRGANPAFVLRIEYGAEHRLGEWGFLIFVSAFVLFGLLLRYRAVDAGLHSPSDIPLGVFGYAVFLVVHWFQFVPAYLVIEKTGIVVCSGHSCLHASGAEVRWIDGPDRGLVLCVGAWCTVIRCKGVWLSPAPRSELEMALLRVVIPDLKLLDT